MPFTILGSFAIAASTDIKALLFWRVIQMFGCSSGFVLGAATIGDIYDVEERGTAMGTFFGVSTSAIMFFVNDTQVCHLGHVTWTRGCTPYRR